MGKTIRRRFKSIFFLAVLLLSCLHGLADTGPKRSVSIHLTNLPEGKVYAAILPQAQEAEKAGNDTSDPSVPQEIKDKFRGYAADGFIFTGGIRDVTESKQIEYHQRLLSRFKLLVYAAKPDTVYVSEVCEQYAFRTEYRADLAGGKLVMINTGTGTTRFLSFAGRLVLTVLTELGVAWLFQIREKRHLIWIVLVNIATQLILNLFLASQLQQEPAVYILEYGLAELCVFILEAFIYCMAWKETGGPEKKRIWLYSFAANAASLLMGFFVLDLLLPVLKQFFSVLGAS